MRTRTAVAVVLLSGLAFLGVPSAAADELLPTPEENSAVTAPTDEPLPVPTPEPSDVPTSEVTPPGPEEAPTEEPAEATNAEAADPVEGADQSPPPAEVTGETHAVEEGEATGATNSPAQSEGQATAGGEGGLRNSQAMVEPVLDPRASIGDVNCSDMTISVTLDNSRSTGAVDFWLIPFGEGVRLAAGATQVVQLPVSDGGITYVGVEATGTSDTDLFGGLTFKSEFVKCTMDGPRASIGDVDCTVPAVPVTLDNSQSVGETTFWVFTQRYHPTGDSDTNEAVVVPAGETRVIQIAPPMFVDEHFRVIVRVGLTEEENPEVALVLAQLSVDCVPSGLTTATIGDADCTMRTIPVTIDNSAVNREVTGLYVNTVYLNNKLLPRPYVFRWMELQVASGAVRVVRVPVPRSNHWRAVRVFAVNAYAQTTLDDGFLSIRVVYLNCPSTAARPTVAVQGAKLPATGGFNLAIPMLGVALLAGGAGMLALSGRRLRY